jgi:hypothetical protein
MTNLLKFTLFSQNPDKRNTPDHRDQVSSMNKLAAIYTAEKPNQKTTPVFISAQ